jgi:hypothetical protein
MRINQDLLLFSAKNSSSSLVKVSIEDNDLIDKLIKFLNNKDLQACFDLLKEQKGRAYRKITKRIKEEIDSQRYDQNQQDLVSGAEFSMPY